MIHAKDMRRAEKQDRQLAQIDRLSAPFKLRLARSIRGSALQALKEGHTNVYFGEDSRVSELFLDVSALGYVHGVKSEKERRKVTIELSLRSQLKKFANSFDIDLGKLKDKLRTPTGKTLKRALAPLEQRINKTLSTISARELGAKSAAKEMKKALTRMGVSAANQSYVDTLVRTHSSLSYNGARYATSQEDDGVWGYKYITMEDNLVRPEHVKLHGLTRKKGDEIWAIIWPPNGWNCRCQIIVLYAKERQSRIPKSFTPDSGFEFNPGIELNIT